MITERRPTGSLNKPKRLERSWDCFAMSMLLMNSSYRPVPKTNMTVPMRYISEVRQVTHNGQTSQLHMSTDGMYVVIM